MEQEHVIAEETAVTNATPDSLTEIIQNKQLNDAGRRQLQAIIELKGKLVESVATLSTLNAHNSELAEEQNRLRQEHR